MAKAPHLHDKKSLPRLAGLRQTWRNRCDKRAFRLRDGVYSTAKDGELAGTSPRGAPPPSDILAKVLVP
jgi:hypothetical protein